MRPIRSLDLLAVHDLWPGPTLRRLEDDHRPVWPGYHTVASRLRLDAPEHGNHRVERVRHELMHRCRLVSLDEVWAVAVAAEKLLQLLMADPRQQSRVGDLVAVEVQDRQGPTVATPG